MSIEAHENTCSAYRQHQVQMSSSTSFSSASARPAHQSPANTGKSSSSSKKRKAVYVDQPFVVPVDFNIHTAPSNHSSISSLPNATNTISSNVNIYRPTPRRGSALAILKNRVLLEKMNAQLAETPSVSTTSTVMNDRSNTSTFETHMQVGSNTNSKRKVRQMQSSTNTHMDASSDSDKNSADDNNANEFDYAGANEIDDEEIGVQQVLQHNESPSPKKMALMNRQSKVDQNFINLFSDQERAALDLIDILEPTGAPKYLNDAILKWAERHVTTDLPPHSTIVTRMKSKYAQEDIDPVRVQKDLPSGNLCTLTKFNIEAQLFSLLSDTELMSPANLLFGEDPFSDIDESDFLGDIDTSKWHRLTKVKICVGGKDVLCPIIGFIDETFIDTKGNLTLEPVSFTLGIFNRACRMTPQAWRHLGFIPKMDKNVPIHKVNIDDLPRWRVMDYHACLSDLLEGLRDIQQAGGLEWRIGEKEVNFKFPVMYIIGDMKGHDKLCGRFGSHNSTSVLRDCNCLRENCNNVDAPCEFIESATIKGLIEAAALDPEEANLTQINKEALSRLRQMSFHHGLQNAFNNICFGANDRGINFATPPELLHLFKMRYPDDAVNGYLALLGKSDATVSKVQLEVALPRIISRSRRQSARNYPRLNNFVIGVQNVKIFTANERYARVFALYLYVLTDAAQYVVRNKQGSDQSLREKHKKYVYFLEFTLTIYAWLYQEEFPKRQSSPPEVGGEAIGIEVIDSYLTLYKELLYDPETGGNTCNFPKFHSMKHLMAYIDFYGCMKNYDGGAPESNFKRNIKRPARLSQGRLSSLHVQTGKNYADMVILNRAIQESGVRTNKDRHQEDLNPDNDMNINDEETDHDVVDEERNHTRRHPCSSTYTFNSTPFTNEYSIQWNPTNVQPTREFDAGILEKIAKKLFHPILGVDAISVPCLTCLEHRRAIFRAHPSYRSGDPWFDYANIKWHGYNRPLPAKIHMFVDLTRVPLKPGSEWFNEIYAVITSVKETNEEPEPSAKMVQRQRGQTNLCTFWTMESSPCFVPARSISSPAFVVENFKDYKLHDPTDCVIEIKPFEEWSSVHNM